MENASKALIIAGAILLSILLIFQLLFRDSCAKVDISRIGRSYLI